MPVLVKNGGLSAAVFSCRSAPTVTKTLKVFGRDVDEDRIFHSCIEERWVKYLVSTVSAVGLASEMAAQAAAMTPVRGQSSLREEPETPSPPRGCKRTALQVGFSAIGRFRLLIPSSYLTPTLLLPYSYLAPTLLLPCSYLTPTLLLPYSYLTPTLLLPCS